jgi:APA family basic amino acid/polyamine antiporter
VSTEPDSREQDAVGGPRGAIWLFAVAYSSIGFSIYFALGVVADRGLGLTPLIFLATGLMFVLTTMTYVEGGAMFRERGGSSMFARYAFNELVSFIAGWAILIDFLIIIALAALSVPHYLSPIDQSLAEAGPEIAVAVAVIVAVAVLNILDLTGRRSQRPLAVLALADLLVQLTIIVVGVFAVWHPERLTDSLSLAGQPGFADVVYAAVLAMLAYAGIEAAANLAPDVNLRRRDLRRIVSRGALTVPFVYAGMSLVALMAVPVVAGPTGPETALGGEFVEDPLVGVVSAYEPGWIADAMRLLVAVVAAPVLFWAANSAMLGLTRHAYTLAVNRQIPSWLGKLGLGHQTPHVAILAAAAIAIGLVIPTDVELLAGIYAFGATLAITIAHFSIVRLRVTDPERRRPFVTPYSIPFGDARIPLPALVGGILTGLAFISVLLYHEEARWVGGGWMLFGLVAYVIYRRFVEETSLTERVMVTPQALTKRIKPVEYSHIMVPIFGTDLDDDIVGTAGRLAAQIDDDGGRAKPPLVELVYVIEVPLTLPLDAVLSDEIMDRANAVVARAVDVSSEYPAADVTSRVVRARTVGSGIVQAAREGEVEAIVIGGEPPSRIQGGSVLGGVQGPRMPEIGPVTEYVLNKADCRVMLTAPPAVGERDGEAEEDEGSQAAGEAETDGSRL